MAGESLIWPDGIVRPSRPPFLVYLDTNHWIGLTKARLARPDGEAYSSLLEALTGAVGAGAVQVVLSSPLAEEILQITDPKQRRALVDSIEALDAFHFLPSRGDVYRHELQSSLDKMTGTVGRGFEPIPLIGSRFLNMFGRRGDIRVIDGEGDDVTSTIPAAVLEDLERRAQKMLLEGPSDADLPQMLANGYRPIPTLPALHDNAEIEQHLTDHQLDAHWRKGRLEDVIAAREMSLELIDELTSELLVRGITLNDFLDGRAQMRAFMMSMPSTVATVKIKTHYHKDSTRRWTVNDLRDIEAMSLAIPYCDFVLTDAAVRNAAVSTKLDRMMSTSIPRTPRDLVRMLDFSAEPPGRAEPR